MDWGSEKNKPSGKCTTPLVFCNWPVHFVVPLARLTSSIGSPAARGLILLGLVHTPTVLLRGYLDKQNHYGAHRMGTFFCSAFPSLHCAPLASNALATSLPRYFLFSLHGISGHSTALKDGIRATVMSPGKARLYSTLIFSSLHLVPPLVKAVSKARALLNIWINGPSHTLEDIRTPLPSSADLAAMEEQQQVDMQNKWNEISWEMWDTLELGLTIFQAVADMRLLSAAIQLQFDEVTMASIMSTLKPSVATEVVADQTAIYFRARAHHRLLLDYSRKWIYTSFALDALHLAANVGQVIYTHYYPTKPSIEQHMEARGALTTPKRPFSWKLFLRSAIIYNVVSIATNSLWYSIFVTSPTFRPKGLTSFTMKVLNDI